jgi:hypothetical protein
VRTADIIEIIEGAMARIQRDAAPTQHAASETLEKQRGVFDDLQRAIEDVIADVHIRRKLIRHIDDANDAVWPLPQIIDSIYCREDFQDLRVLVTDLRLEERMGGAWTEGPDSTPINSRPQGRPHRFGLTWTAFGRSWSLDLSFTAGVPSDDSTHAC